MSPVTVGVEVSPSTNTKPEVPACSYGWDSHWLKLVGFRALRSYLPVTLRQRWARVTATPTTVAKAATTAKTRELDPGPAWGAKVSPAGEEGREEGGTRWKRRSGEEADNSPYCWDVWEPPVLPEQMVVLGCDYHPTHLLPETEAPRKSGGWRCRPRSWVPACHCSPGGQESPH